MVIVGPGLSPDCFHMILGLLRYIDTSMCIDTDLAHTVSIRLGAVSRYFQKY